MKKTINELLFALIFGLVLPVVFVQVLGRILSDHNQQVIPFAQTEVLQTTVETQAKHTDSVAVLWEDGSVRNMELETYLCGVVLGEMPADFETETLKAQAVVARTYTYKRMYTSGKHENAAVCTESGCCQEYCDEETYFSRGGTQEAADKIRTAVQQTSGQVLTYNGQLIEATYFSCSGGRTESAVAVWGSDIPYLQAIDSPGEEEAEYYIDTVSFTADTFSDLLGIQLDGQPGSWFGDVTYTDGGGVATIQIGQELFDGVTVRQRLGLRSTAFVMRAVGQTVTVTTKGFGHRVGMSQYGAEAMAEQGADYRQILEYYYSGTHLETWHHN